MEVSELRLAMKYSKYLEDLSSKASLSAEDIKS